MRYFFWVILLSLFLSHVSFAAKSVYILNISGAIGPSTEDYISQGLTTAHQEEAALVIIQLNTPGGLEKSIRKMTQEIIESPIPVVSFIAPEGAHVEGSAIFIVYASRIAAMAMGTKIGGMTPLYHFTHEFFLNTSQMNNAVTTIRRIATLNNRNADFAEDALRNNTDQKSTDALKANVINVIANTIPELLQKLNGKTIDINRIPITLETDNLQLKTLNPNWRCQALFFITNPIIIYLLLLIGILCVFFTFLHPFKVFSGIVGILCLIIFFYAFQALPGNYLGLTLLLVGITCMIREIGIANHGVTSAIGILIFIAGSFLMLDIRSPGYYLSLYTLLLISLAGTSLFYLIVIFTVKVIRPKKRKHLLKTPS